MITSKRCWIVLPDVAFLDMGFRVEVSCKQVTDTALLSMSKSRHYAGWADG